MKKVLFVFLLLFIACQKQEKADLLVVNATIYTVNDSFAKAEAFAVKD